MHEIAYSSDSVVHDATEMMPGNIMEQTTFSETYQAQLIVKHIHGSPTNQGISIPDSKQDGHPAKEKCEDLVLESDNDVCDTRKQQSSNIERDDTALGHVLEVEGTVHQQDVAPTANQETPHIDFSFEKVTHDATDSSEIISSASSLETLHSETNVPFDPQLQQNPTSFHSTGHRRKMGSRRKNKGRTHFKDSGAESDQEPTVDVVGHVRDNETQEHTEMALKIETEVQEKSMETLLKEMGQLDLAQTEGVGDQVKLKAQDDTLVAIADINSLGLQSTLTTGPLEIDQSNFRDKQHEELPNVFSVTERENKGDEDTDWLRQGGHLPDMECSFPTEKNAEEQSIREHTELEGSAEQDIVSPTKEEVNANEGRDHKFILPEDDHSEDAVNKPHEQDVEPTENQEKPQMDFSFEKVTHDATDSSEIISSASSLETLHSETNVPFDPQLQQNPTSFQSTGHRRKMGSRRKNKGRTHFKDSGAESDQEPTVDVVGHVRDNETQEHTEMALKIETEVQEKSMETLLKEMDQLDLAQTEGVGDQVKLKAQDDTLVSIDLTSSSSAVDTHSTFRQILDEELLDERGKDNDLFRQDGNLQSSSLVVESHVKSEDKESSIALEKGTEQIPEEHYETECTLEPAAVSPSEEQLSTNEGQKQHVNLPQVTGTWHSHDSINQTKKEHKSQEIDVSNEITKVELFSAPHALATCDIGLKQAETAVDWSEQSGPSSPQGMHEKNHPRSTQRRRKMGSTRQTQFNRRHGEKRVETQESDTKADTQNLDRMEIVEELTTTNATSAVVTEENRLKSFFKDTSKEQSAFLNEGVVHPVEFVHAADVKHHMGNAAVSGEPSHDVSGTDTNPLLSISKGTANNGTTGAAHVTSSEPTKSTGEDEERQDNVNIIQHRALISTEDPVAADLEIVMSGVEGGAAEEQSTTQAMEPETDTAQEAAHNKNPEERNTSPCLDPKNRRRKMGSTRRNLRTGTKQEALHRTWHVSDEVTETATNVVDVKTESSSSIPKEELHVDAADKDGGTETTEYSHTSESHKPAAHQTFEEPSTSPKDGLMSQSAFGGRRRKMGSNRKSQGLQSHDNQTARVEKIQETQNERDVRSIREENAIEAKGLREESSKVDPSHKKKLSHLSSSKEGDPARPVGEKTPEPVTAAQHHNAGLQGSPQRFSLENRPDLKSNAYNVMMVGDSSVGKSSFMKRAQSGKFSLDLPASVGLDSCLWTVLVEGKPVVLQLWDTAGQERFHSITKQTFHKAHAFLLMYDITCSQSFSAVSYWESCIREATAESVTILLVGNKSDAERQVKTQEAEILAKDYRFEFMECSAATGENVIQCLETLARMLSQKDETRKDNVVLLKEPQQKTSRCC
ncbi:uncharacterized protein rab44 [Spinachia spinachia]